MLDLTRHWYRNGPGAFLLLPLTGLYCLLAQLRRRWLMPQAKPLPQGVKLIIVGNITVGGTGKTPMVIWLAEYLRAHGMRPGIVSRGYGGKHDKPLLVTANSDARSVGDEAVVIARRTDCPVWVCRDRPAAIQALLAAYDVDIIVADDGLQHYRMPRDIEIAMIDGARRFGNGLCLPSGPLREPVSRLQEVDFRVVTGSLVDEGEYSMEIVGEECVNLRSPAKRMPLKNLDASEINAVAGLGNPSRFFFKLESAGLEVNRRIFPDHHKYTVEDFRYDNAHPIVMTEKDAVKCSAFADERFWYIPIRAKPEPAFANELLRRIKESQSGQ